MVHRTGLENRQRRKPFVGSNPTPSAIQSARFAAVALLRGASSRALFASDAHQGLTTRSAPPRRGPPGRGGRTHFMRNLLCHVPKSAQSFVTTPVHAIFAQPDAASAHEQHARVIAQLAERFPGAAPRASGTLRRRPSRGKLPRPAMAIRARGSPELRRKGENSAGREALPAPRPIACAYRPAGPSPDPPAYTVKRREAPSLWLPAASVASTRQL